MKIICTQENLKAGLNIVGRIVSTNNTLPILNNVLLKTENGQLRLSTTNLEIAITTHVRCKIEQEGSVCLPVKTLTDLVVSLPNENITLTNNKDEVEIKTDHYINQIKGFSSDEFPLIPSVESNQEITLEPNDLKQAIDMVVFAASTNETQPEISGVLISKTDTELKFVATDRYRLAEKNITVHTNHPLKEAIVPQKAILELSRVIGANPATTKFILSDNQVAISVGETELVSRLIDGQYPDYKQIIPDSFSTTITTSRSELIAAIKTAGIFSRTSHSISFGFEEKKESLLVSAAASDIGKSEAQVTAQIKGPAGTIAFNHYYLLDALQAMTAGEVIFKLNTDSQAVVITPKDDQSYLYLVMPIKH